MLKTTTDDPSSIKPADTNSTAGKKQNKGNVLASFVKSILQRRKTNNKEALREAIEEYIEERDEENPLPSAVASHEKSLISNVLKLRDLTVIDVMIPRADIASIEVGATQESLMALLADRQFSRIPVYKETLDEVLGSIHIKDILSIMASNMPLEIKSMIRPVPIVSPSMPALDLLLKMQSDKKHMVFVVDEYGGIDGLVTIGDLIEEIVGEFEDEFDTDIAPQMIERSDGSLICDGRVDIEEFEEAHGALLNEEEREEVDTLGGLVVMIANRIPARGEVIKHESGMVFEVIDADQRRIASLRVRDIPKKT